MRQVGDIVAGAPGLKVGRVQPNFAYAVNGEFSRDEAIRQLTALQAESRRLQQAGAQLVVGSEGSYPVTLPRDFAADLQPESLGMIRRGLNIPVVIGADMYDAAHDDAFNSAILLDGDGRAAGHYDKVRLLAVGEYIPSIDTFPCRRKLLPPVTGHVSA